MRIPLHPDTWAGLAPNGIGQQKPHHLREMLTAARINRGNLPYAWKLLTQGVCDGCALGVAGLHDWTLPGIHLCTTRLRLLELNTAPIASTTSFGDIEELRAMTNTQLRQIGRLGFPMIRSRGEPGFRRIDWEQAEQIIGEHYQATTPDRIGWYLTSRGITNETYYVAGKAARALGIGSIDSAARLCHSPSSIGLMSTTGVAASTCSLQDVLETEVIVLWGTNPANNQPVFMKYLDKAVKAGAKVVVVNPYLEPGLDRYWVPSLPESYLFGTKISSLHLPVRPGGDIALASLTLKRLIELDLVDRAFIDAHTSGFSDFADHVDSLNTERLLEECGLEAPQVERFVHLLGRANRGILIWSMGITQHAFGADGVRAIVNLALARGFVGRDGCGLMPIRGHSGVQGGAEMGAYATALPGQLPHTVEHRARLAEQWGFDIPDAGLTVNEMLDAASRGDIDVLISSGGNFLEILPDPDGVQQALQKPGLRVHLDIVATSQMLVEGDTVLVLPVRTRYEQRDGGTSTTTERRVAYSPEIPRDVAQARSEWEVYARLASRLAPQHAGAFAWTSGTELRAEIETIVPSYAGLAELSATGDAIQWGGRHLCEGGSFPTPDGRGHFSVIASPQHVESQTYPFLLTTRRGKQFNTLIWEQEDPLTGASRRAVLVSTADASRHGLVDGGPVELTSEYGTFSGEVFLADIPNGTLQAHWPECNGLLGNNPSARERSSKMPSYDVRVRMQPLDAKTG